MWPASPTNGTFTVPQVCRVRLSRAPGRAQAAPGLAAQSARKHEWIDMDQYLSAENSTFSGGADNK